MITTGICFSLDDSCKIDDLPLVNEISIESILGEKRLPSIGNSYIPAINTYLDLLQEFVSRHLRHPVIRNYHAHVGLLQFIPAPTQNADQETWTPILHMQKKAERLQRRTSAQRETEGMHTNPNSSSALFPLSTAVTAHRQEKCISQFSCRSANSKLTN